MNKYKLYGAILGDLAGQPFEFGEYKGKLRIHNPDSHITDDTLMTLATADSIMCNNPAEFEYKAMGKMYPGDYYGKNFKAWLKSSMGTVGDSWGNGCLMRISPYMYLPNSLSQIMTSVMCSHSSDMAIESCVKLYRAYRGDFMHQDYAHCKTNKKFRVEADATIDLVLQVFKMGFSSTRTKILEIIKMGGDTDTNASIIGELSNFYLGDLNKKDIDYVESKLDKYQLDILKRFNHFLNK